MFRLPNGNKQHKPSAIRLDQILAMLTIRASKNEWRVHGLYLLSLDWLNTIATARGMEAEHGRLRFRSGKRR